MTDSKIEMNKKKLDELEERIVEQLSNECSINNVLNVRDIVELYVEKIVPNFDSIEAAPVRVTPVEYYMIVEKGIFYGIMSLAYKMSSLELDSIEEYKELASRIAKKYKFGL